MVALADWLPWKQSRISEAERGLRRVPDWVPERMRTLEAAREELIDRMLDALEEDQTSALIVHASDATYRAVHPDEDVPAAVQRIAAGLAAAEWEAQTGTRPHVVLAEA